MVATKQNLAARQTEPHLKKFERFENETKQPSWVFPLRKAGIARFAELGFPTLKDEDWRFTNIAPIADLPFNPVFAPTANGLKPDVLAHFPFSSLSGTRLVFVDGHWSEKLSTPEPAAIKVCNLASALAADSALLQKHLGRYAQGEDNAFTSLNAAFFQDGAFIHVPAGKVVEEPIHLIYIATGKQTDAAV